jgi:hypothetical protein
MKGRIQGLAGKGAYASSLSGRFINSGAMTFGIWLKKGAIR